MGFDGACNVFRFVALLQNFTQSDHSRPLYLNMNPLISRGVERGSRQTLEFVEHFVKETLLT
eukprot:704157-Amphidinium_carterae.1